MMYGPLYVGNPAKDLDVVDSILNYDGYSKRFKEYCPADMRPLLAPDRSLGSVIKMLTPFW